MDLKIHWILGLTSIYFLNCVMFGDSSSQEDLPVMIDREKLTDRLNDNVYTIEFHGSNIVHHLNVNESSRTEFYLKLRNEILKYLNRKYVDGIPESTSSNSLTTLADTSASNASDFSSSSSSELLSSTPSSSSPSSPELLSSSSLELLSSSSPPSSPSPSDISITTDYGNDSSSTTSSSSRDTSTTFPRVDITMTDLLSMPMTSQSPISTVKTEEASPTATIQVPDTTMNEYPTSTEAEEIIDREPPISKRKRRSVQNHEKIYPTDSIKFIPLKKQVRNESFLVTLTLDSLSSNNLKEAIRHIQDTNALFNLTELTVRTFYKGFPADDTQDVKLKASSLVIWIIVLSILLFIIACIVACIIYKKCRNRYRSHTLNHVVSNNSTQQLVNIKRPSSIDDNEGWIIPMDEFSGKHKHAHHNSR